jgi:DNA-binding GntR family transcriptional regulator
VSRSVQPLTRRRGKSGVGRPRGTGAQVVFDTLRERILSLEIAPLGDIDELNLAKEFNLSRTPIREALIRLSSEGLIQLLPNRGPRVASLNAQEVPQILEALELAQRTVTRWAAQRRDDNDVAVIALHCSEFSSAVTAGNVRAMGESNRIFHGAIGRACGNHQLANWYEGLLNSSMRLARAAYGQSEPMVSTRMEYLVHVDLEHRAMVDAIRHQDFCAAEQLAREHAVLFRNRVMEYLSESRSDEISLSNC